MPTRRRRLGGDVCTIFIHAGAGFHSIQNEKLHLAACEDAAKSAMALLNAGGDAADAVEIAIKVLEDKEITNAGYGSNLAIDGTVECDATVVDHFGRSGAVGAVSQIRNPIHLARLVLEHSTKPLSLRRVPPNLLVGQGAVNFAFGIGLPILPTDALTSAGAHERWVRWKADLMRTDKLQEDESRQRPEHLEKQLDSREGQRRRDAQTRLLAACWNESQPYSPALTPSGSSDPTEIFGPTQAGIRTHSPKPTSEKSGVSSSSSLAGPLDPDKAAGKQHISWQQSKQNNDGQGYTSLGDEDGDDDDEESSLIDDNPSLENFVRCHSTHQYPPNMDVDLPELSADGDYFPSSLSTNLKTKAAVREDHITDTVGAIAIDCLGNIAAGSSSGGIGMKHNGRVGPAALVGIGTAVIPIDPEDAFRTSTATVTSGTGEHMATTMAAMTCASRVYNCERKSKDGLLESTDPDSAMQAFVQKDFMDHPSVKHSNSAGAIGVLALKKTKNGIWLYWGHNTDSFALASMSSDDSKPKSLMSRNNGDAKIVTGGRSIRHHRAANWPGHSYWPVNPVEALDAGSAPSSPEQPVAKKQKTKRIPTKYVYDYQGSAPNS